MRRLKVAVPWSTLGQVLAIYLAGAWLVLQVIDVLSDNLDLPGWIFRAVLLLLLVGLPAVLVAALFTSRSGGDSARPLRQAGAAVLAIAVIGGLLVSIPGVRQTGRKALLGADLPGVGILPFGYVGADSANAYLADMISVTLSEVVQRTGVFSPSWPAVQRFRVPLPPLAEIGRELSVQYILTGDLIVREGQLELSVWLTRVRDNTPVWQRTFKGNSQDIADFEFDIARAVVDSLATYVGIEPEKIPVRRYTEDTVADSLYARGLYLMNQFYNMDTTLVAKRLFERAIERDSSFAPAYVALAGTISALSRVAWLIPPAEAGPQVRELLRQAQGIAPELADVWRHLGWYYYVFEWDWTAANLSLREAIEISPKDPESLVMASFVQIATGHADSAVNLARAGSALEPYNPLIVSTECWILYLAHRYSQGAERCRFVVDSVQPGHGAAVAIGQTIAFTERFLASPAPAAARDSAAQSLLAAWTPPTVRLQVRGEMSDAMRLAQLGWDAEARRLLAADMSVDGFRPLRVANVYAALGDMEMAWQWLETAFEAGDPNLAEIKSRPEMGPFRADPRYDDFLRRMNLD
ncbi:MAG: hypothetical protein ABFS14_05660 [Gemmatimonadota bacterium]